MKKCCLGLLVVGLCLSVGSPSFASSTAEQERGAKILDKQLQRARHLKELEYQAEVLERQARIAKAQQQIDKTIGLETLGDFQSIQSTKSKPSAQPKKVKQPRQPLPKIVELTASLVTFEFADGETGVFAVGDELPSGHRLRSISMVKGVVLAKGASEYQLNFSW